MWEGIKGVTGWVFDRVFYNKRKLALLAALAAIGTHPEEAGQFVTNAGHWIGGHMGVTQYADADTPGPLEN